MARYDFKCEQCDLVIEHIQSMKDPLPDVLFCPRCKTGSCRQVIYAPMISKAGMTHEPFDIAIGRDAEARWADIRRRQELRNKVRKETGSQALTMTGRNEFRPLEGGRLEAVEIASDKVQDTPPSKPATAPTLD